MEPEGSPLCAGQDGGLMNGFMAALALYTKVITNGGACSSHGGACSSQLTDLHTSLCDKGFQGATALSLLQRSKTVFSWQALDSQHFFALYRFMYFICRHKNKRFISMECANQLWAILLHGRFRRLQEWCSFTAHSRLPIVTEDTWCQVLEFTKYIYEDLSNYDIDSAWPTLIDDFVSHVRCKHSPSSVREQCMSPSALAHAGLLPVEVAPRAGSKRKLDDAEQEDLSKRFACMSPDEDDEPSNEDTMQTDDRGSFSQITRPHWLHSRVSHRVARKTPPSSSLGLS